MAKKNSHLRLRKVPWIIITPAASHKSREKKGTNRNTVEKCWRTVSAWCY